MSVKSQQDIKNATKAKENQVPKSMEGKYGPHLNNKPVQQSTQSQKPQVTVEQRLEGIERYLSTVDQAFSKIVEELTQLRNVVNSIGVMDNEISKITGDIVRLTKLEEERYIELVSAINQTHNQVETLNEAIPTYIDKRIGEYFEDLVAEDELPEDLKKQDATKTQ